MPMGLRWSGRAKLLLTGMGALLLPMIGLAQSSAVKSGFSRGEMHGPELVWIDTDIGDDIDDAFAVSLMVRSPEVHVLGISTAFGDTETRARLTDRFLKASGVASIPVTAGVHTETSNVMTQRTYAEHSPDRKYADGVAAMLAAIREHPGQVTLLAIGPLFNVGAAIDRDATTFHKLKRVVMMGGSIQRGYDGANGERKGPDAEWNILQDPKGAQKLFASGVPIYMMPLDSTQIHLEREQRDKLFATGAALTDQITLLYHQWIMPSREHAPTPTLFDPVAASYIFRPDLCPMEPMRIAVDDKGFTKQVDGSPNAQVCLKSDESGFLSLLLSRLEATGK
ncbi:nucleoside hydrolase [Acidicapsa dinghuensis]|uniref:Nucleoside hydrolase n=1 Tax=Acidicapsa dinghuensis TaxID=2218256 RepID=A0ABW1EC48_9BACT|nr:nucleoside hydrolase [Acidicapsa dinghuensis]